MAKLNPETAGNSSARLGRKLGFFVVNLAASAVVAAGGVVVGVAQGTGKVAKDAWDATEEKRADLRQRLDDMALEDEEREAVMTRRQLAAAEQQLAEARKLVAEAEAAKAKAEVAARRTPAEQVKVSKTANGRRQVATVIEGEVVTQQS